MKTALFKILALEVLVVTSFYLIFFCYFFNCYFRVDYVLETVGDPALQAVLFCTRLDMASWKLLDTVVYKLKTSDRNIKHLSLQAD